jgi:hypothetical protein
MRYSGWVAVADPTRVGVRAAGVDAAARGGFAGAAAGVDGGALAGAGDAAAGPVVGAAPGAEAGGVWAAAFPAARVNPAVTTSMAQRDMYRCGAKLMPHRMHERL